MTDILRSTHFEAAGITLLDVGPLRGTTTLDFLVDAERSANIYLVMGPNGGGKTTLLEAIVACFDMLAAEEHDTYGIASIDRGEGGVQLDAIVHLDDGRSAQTYLLSLVLGTPGLLKNWSEDELRKVGAVDQIQLRYGRRSGSSKIIALPESAPPAIAFAQGILTEMDSPTQGLFGSGSRFPTVLYFPSDRGISRHAPDDRAIVRPRDLAYAPVHRFGSDKSAWADTLDNLFVWFAWLDDDREKECRQLVNELVFRDGHKRLGPVDRNRLRVPVDVDGHTHGLDELSSGERQLVQLIARIAAHMTRSTIVLVDETEQHLHLVMRRRLMTILKEWAAAHEGLSFILTSHQSDTLRILAPKVREEGLRKGGCLVKPKFKGKQ